MNPKYFTKPHPKEPGRTLFIEETQGGRTVLGEHLATWKNTVANIFRSMEKRKADGSIRCIMTNKKIHLYCPLLPEEQKEITNLLNRKRKK